jgi:ABC-type amino acid transport substrate-binding protein
MVFAAAVLAAMNPASAQQVLRVGLQNAEPGVVRSNNEIGGLQIEVLEAIAKNAGFKVAFTITENTRKSFGLMDEGKLDAVAGTTVTAENQAKYSFTVGYGTTAEALVVPKTDKKQYVTIADAKALTIVTLRASPYAAYLKQNGIINYKEVETTTDALMAVSTDKLTLRFSPASYPAMCSSKACFPTSRSSPPTSQPWRVRTRWRFQRIPARFWPRRTLLYKNWLTKERSGRFLPSTG